MVSELNKAQADLLRAQCVAVFSMYELQSNAGINLGHIMRMPESLARALPVRCIQVKHDGCLKILRVFDSEKAGQLLRLLDFQNYQEFLQYLEQYGYEQCREEFIRRLTLYIQSEQAKQLSLF